MAVSQNNERDRESDSREPRKEHSSYNEAILVEEISFGLAEFSNGSGREVPVLVIGPEPGSERLYIQQQNVQVVPRIAHPVSSNSAESEAYSQNRDSFNNSSNGEKMVNKPLQHSKGPQALQSSISSSNAGSERLSLNLDPVTNSSGDVMENQSNISVGRSEATSVSFSDGTSTGNRKDELLMQQQQTATADLPPEESSMESAAQPDNNDVVKEMEFDKPAQDCPTFPPLCIRCHQERINTILKCEDVCLCRNCAKHLKATKGKCPMCSKQVVYYSSANLPYPK